MQTSILNIFLSCFVIYEASCISLGRPSQGYLYPPVKPDSAELPPENWFLQALDHSDPTSNSTWKQRYFFDGSFYKPGGPVFLMIGGEGPASAIWMTTGTWHSYAKQLGAFMFQLEHRFYGKSHPTKDVTVESLKFLTTEQALSDLAEFIVSMKQEHSLKDNKWISFGGSYPGTLSAWIRLKYPHLVHAAVASSAPIVAQVNFKEYLEVVQKAFAITGPECNSAIKAATRQLDMFLQHRFGWNIISKDFRLCKPLDGLNKLDVSNLHSTLAGNFENVVQYNKDNRAFEGAKGTNITIDTVCTMMTDSNVKLQIARYAAVNSLTLDTYGMDCLNHSYTDMIKDLKSTSWNNEDIGGRAWTYQTCTEYGFYQGTDSNKQPFGNHFPSEFFIQQCKDIFGPKFTLQLLLGGVRRTNTLYGGRELKVKRVVFVNGSIDPWHALGITKQLNEDAPAIFINGTAHCANMYPDSPNDLPQLKEARTQVLNLLIKWLKE